jgi:ubiquinone biosynthesis UbiH/UbiF/VisC/COQ6 family hydroxylase
MIGAFAKRVNLRLILQSGRFWSSTTAGSLPSSYDVVIVGGGVVGSALAGRLVEDSPSLRIALVEAGPGPPKTTQSIDTSQPPNPRSYALSLASMKTLGCLDQLTITRLGGPYNTMQVWEEGQPAPLIWSAQDDLPTTKANNDFESSHPMMLGACFEDHVLQSLLWKRFDGLDSSRNSGALDVFTNSTVQGVTWNPHQPDDWIKASIDPSNDKEEGSQRQTIRTRLLVAADGGRSQLRDSVFQINTSSRRFDYQQSAVTATVRLDSPLKGRAFQRFLNTGPLALLPTRCPNHAVFVWSLPTAMAQQLIKDQNNNSALLVERLNQQLQVGLEPIPRMFASNRMSPLPSFLHNEIDRLLDTLHFAPPLASSAIDQFRAAPMIRQLATSAVSFPLVTQMAETFTTRYGGVLIGDAAHTVHPLAGQGLNLGLGAVQVLANAIRDHGRYQDVRAALPAYEYDMQTHKAAAVASIHAIQCLFQESSILAKHGKSLGMNLVQSVPPIRKALVRAACFGHLM